MKIEIVVTSVIGLRAAQCSANKEITMNTRTNLQAGKSRK
jgi:hypothetical protein